MSVLDVIKTQILPKWKYFVLFVVGFCFGTMIVIHCTKAVNESIQTKITKGEIIQIHYTTDTTSINKNK